jgi:hypothetical protein
VIGRLNQDYAKTVATVDVVGFPKSKPFDEDVLEV